MKKLLGEWVWVDSKIGVHIGARVKETPSGQRLLVDDEGNERKLSLEEEASLKIMHPTSVEGVDDMIKLGDMTEAALLRNLLLRHKQGYIYTFIGSVLVAVNPYQDFPIYSPEQVNLYHSRKLGELPPHIFAIAESCYFNMRRNLRNQCCIISGESGAGKTESTKLILQYLAAVSGQLSQQSIENQILQSNPILEAFGNAKTIRNDNSSRFGKYLEIFFNQDGVIEGARVEQYLLEKSRVCHQASQERNYHIFYCLLAGISTEERKSLRLDRSKEYNYITKGNCMVCEGRDDAKDFNFIRSAMKTLNFSEDQFQEILKLLAAMLHLGNVSFKGSVIQNLEISDVGESENFTIASSLLQVQRSVLADSLTHRSFMTNRERVTKALSAEQATDCRDAFVKAIYNKLFIWIVGKINSVIYEKLSDKPSSSLLSIGLLDIFGFENFQTNSFEQLCINFANEKLQQFFVAHIFKLEQKEYQKEGVLWNNIQFTDNQKVLELLAGKRCNVLALIDEESHFPQGTDSTLLTKLNKEHQGDKDYIGSKREHETDFGIRHFAGPVYYNTNGFLEKNRDGVSYDIIKTIGVSTNKLLREIFEKDMPTNGLKAAKNAKFILSPQNSPRLQNDKRKQMPTLSGQFRVSLDSLMKALSVCQPFFIRCFKPNNDKQSKKFDRELCMRQLRYSGMMDTIRIRKLGYPVRHKFEDFLSRYRVLLKTTVCDPKTTDASVCCEAICKAVIKGRDEWKIGKKKIFLKDAHDAVLENLREAELSRVAVVIQRVMLGIKDRKLFLRKRGAAVVLQKQWRAYRERVIQQGFGRLVSKVRGRKLKSQFQRRRAAAVVIQSQACVRGYRARKDYRQKREEIAHQAMLLEMERQEEEDLSEELHQRLMQVAEEQADIESQKSGRSHESKKSSESEKSSEAEKSSEEMTVVVTPASNSASSTPSLDEEEEEEIDDGFDDETDIFSFYNFSKRHFQKDEDHKYTAQRLKQPLLHHEDEADALASLTVSWIIMRFMGDIPEQKSTDTLSQHSSTMSQSTLSRLLPGRQGRRLSNLVGLDQKILRKNKKKFGAGNRKASAILEEPENLTEDEDILVGESTTLYRQLTQLEKLHIIVGYGMSRQGIRDEIYCQICKQLVNNRNRKSCMQGWALLSLCLGIFPPTSLFMECLESFLQRGPYGYREYCIERLHRIVANGERKELPCWLELKAATNKEPIDSSVTLMNGETIKVQLDSASTSSEVCQAVANKLGLKDTFGFSVYISFYEKMWSLGSCGKNHVLDAVSQCEQEMRRQGREEKDTPWSLSIRKELFSPWHDCDQDAVSTDLIYKQVIKGIKSGEYVSEKEDEYVQLAAMHYFVQFGSQEPTRERVQSVVQECITTTRIESRSMTMWIDLITEELSKVKAQSSCLNVAVKGDVVDIARQNWPLDFSKLYEVTMTSGRWTELALFFVAVNWKSIVFMERREKLLLEIPYVEVKKVQMSVSVDTLRGQYTLRCQDVADMTKMMQYNVNGLKQRSVYAVVQQDVPKQDDPVYLVCKRGDLLLVEKDGYPPDSNLLRAVNQRTKSSGVVYKDKMEFLPTLTEPPEDMLTMLSPKQRKASVPTIVPLVEETVAPVSLKEFALENFRSVGKGGGRGSKGANKERLWIFSKEPIKQPLLKTLLNNPELSNMACNYMGDYPIKHSRSPTELTDQIFGSATKHEELQDEIYCQIMRQMTTNNSRMSVDRGWQLMWMCTGLFPPGPRLRKHAQRFLESRPRDPLAAGCLQRFQDFSSKAPRTLPPHQAEVEAIQQNSTQIFYKVHFPNDTDLVEVSSTITNRELRHSIAAQLSLSSAEGYGLYMKVTQKVRYKVEFTQSNAPLLVVYRRKLWFNVIPGKDLIADLTFHYPQEVPKYLRGYHTCTKEDMFNLGGLLFRVAVDSDRSQFVMIPRMLNELVPFDKVQMMQPDEWKKNIISSYNKQSGMTVQEAKIAFLRAISNWPNFGCSFFDVKQNCEPDYPNTLWFTVSKKGVSLIDPKTKELQVMHPFNRITDYSSTGNIFQMTIHLNKSYIRMYEEQKMINRPKNNMFP
uniref:Unconventional myosin-VIIa-like n=1 Tax=Poecilia latipinna TaxID=48699 RepID=A0A3B3UW20_9TELE